MSTPPSLLTVTQPIHPLDPHALCQPDQSGQPSPTHYGTPSTSATPPAYFSSSFSAEIHIEPRYSEHSLNNTF
jgi:hypothetical protein